MKKLPLILLAFALINCSNADDSDYSENIEEATIIGRWVIPGFEDNIRLKFMTSKRSDIYGIDGTFPTLEEFTPRFVCDNSVVQLIDDHDDIMGANYR